MGSATALIKNGFIKDKARMYYTFDKRKEIYVPIADGNYNPNDANEEIAEKPSAMKPV